MEKEEHKNRSSDDVTWDETPTRPFARGKRSPHSVKRKGTLGMDLPFDRG